jgi:hypothetical protein
MKNLHFYLLLAFLLCSFVSRAAQTPAGTEDWSARLSPDGRHVDLAFEGQTWLTGLRVRIASNREQQVTDRGAAKLTLVRATKSGETLVKVTGPTTFDLVLQAEGSRLQLSLRGLNAPEGVELEGAIHAGSDPLPARLDNLEDDVMQMLSGAGASGLNDCVYDRFRDQALKIMARTTHLTPGQGGFSFSAEGPAATTPFCALQMFTRVYSSRFPYYKPLDKKQWGKVPVSWGSWYYYFLNVTEADVLRNADAVARDYKPFGLEYCGVDGTWQKDGTGKGGHIGGSWTESNAGFPHGMKWLADEMRARGLKPTMWLCAFGNNDEDFCNAHKSWFLHDESGNPVPASYSSHLADLSNPEVRKYLADVYRRQTLEWGYEYYKLDGLNEACDLFAQHRAQAFNPAVDAQTAFREALGEIREAMNSRPGVFFNACGPSFPTEAMGISQGGRLGVDVLMRDEPVSFRGVRVALEAIRRGYYTHNISWYSDPDYLLLRPPLGDDEARTWTSILGLTGQVLALGDDMAALPADRREMIRKVIPVADVTPTDLYPLTTDRPIWALHIARPFGAWTVVGLFNWDYDTQENPAVGSCDSCSLLKRNDALLGINRGSGARYEIFSSAEKSIEENRRYMTLPSKPPGLQLIPVPAYLTPLPPRNMVLDFRKIGLDRTREYLLFDFWNQKFLGKVSGQYAVSLTAHQCQVVSLRPAENHPQLAGTDRHITMGGVELKDERWDVTRKQLSIKVELVENYPTTLTVYAAGRRLKEAAVTGADVQTASEGETVRAKLLSPKSGIAEVTLKFE